MPLLVGTESDTAWDGPAPASPRSGPHPRVVPVRDKSFTQLKRTIRHAPPGPRKRNLRENLRKGQELRSQGREISWTDDWRPVPLSPKPPTWAGAPETLLTHPRGFSNRPERPRLNTTENLNDVLKSAPLLPPDVALALSGSNMTPTQIRQAADIFMDDYGADKLLLGASGWQLKNNGTVEFWRNKQTGQRMTTRQADQLLMKNSSSWVPVFAESIRNSLTTFTYKQYVQSRGLTFSGDDKRAVITKMNDSRAEFQAAIKNLKPHDVLLITRFLMGDPDIKNTTNFQEVTAMATMVALQPSEVQLNFVQNFKVLGNEKSMSSAFERVSTALGLAQTIRIESLDDWVMWNAGDTKQAYYVQAASRIRAGITEAEVAQWQANFENGGEWFNDPRAMDEHYTEWILTQAYNRAEVLLAKYASDNNMSVEQAKAEFEGEDGGWFQHFIGEALPQLSAKMGGEKRMPGTRQKMLSDYIKGFSSNYRQLGQALEISGSKEFQQLDAQIGMDQSLPGLFLEATGDRWRGAMDWVEGVPGGAVLAEMGRTAQTGLANMAGVAWDKFESASMTALHFIQAAEWALGSLLGNSFQALGKAALGEEFSWQDEVFADWNTATLIMQGKVGLGSATAEQLEGADPTLFGEGGPADNWPMILGFYMDMSTAIFNDPMNLPFSVSFMRHLVRSVEGSLQFAEKFGMAAGAKWGITKGLPLWERTKLAVRYAQNRSELVNLYWKAIVPRALDTKKLRAGANITDPIKLATRQSDFAAYAAEVGAKIYNAKVNTWLDTTLSWLDKTPVEHLIKSARSARNIEWGGSYFYENATKVFRNRFSAGGMPRKLTDKIRSLVDQLDDLRAGGAFDDLTEEAFEEMVKRRVKGALLKGFGFHSADEARELEKLAEAVHEARRVSTMPHNARRRGPAQKAAQALGDKEGAKTPFTAAREALNSHFDGYDPRWMDPKVTGPSKQRLARADELLQDFLANPGGGWSRYGPSTRMATNIPYGPGFARLGRIATSNKMFEYEPTRNILRNIQNLSSALPRLVADLEGDLGTFVEQYARRANVFDPEEVARLREAAEALSGRGAFNRLRKGVRERNFIKFMEDLANDTAARIFRERGLIVDDIFEQRNGKWFIKSWQDDYGFGTQPKMIGYDTLQQAERAYLENIWQRTGWSLRKGQIGLNAHLFAINREVLERGLREGDDVVTIVARGRGFFVNGVKYDTLDEAKKAAKAAGKGKDLEISVQSALFETQLPNMWAMFDPFRLRQAVDGSIGYGQKVKAIIQRNLTGNVSEATLKTVTLKRTRDAILDDLGTKLVRAWKMGAVATPRYLLRVPLGDEQLRQMADLGFFTWLGTKRITAKLAGEGDTVIVMPIAIGGAELHGALTRAGLSLDEAMDLKKAERIGIISDVDAKRLQRLPDWVHQVFDETIDGAETKVTNPAWDEAFGRIIRGEKPDTGVMLKGMSETNWDALDPEQRMILEKMGWSKDSWDTRIHPVVQRVLTYLESSKSIHGANVNRGYNPANDLDALLAGSDRKEISLRLGNWLAEQVEMGNMTREMATTYHTGLDFLLAHARGTGLDPNSQGWSAVMDYFRSMFADQGMDIGDNAEAVYRLLGFGENDARAMIERVRGMTGYLRDPNSGLGADDVIFMERFDHETVEEILGDAVREARRNDGFTFNPYNQEVEATSGKLRWSREMQQALGDLKTLRLLRDANISGPEMVDKYLAAVNRILYHLDGDSSLGAKYARLEDAYRGDPNNLPITQVVEQVDEVEEAPAVVNYPESWNWNSREGVIDEFRGEAGFLSNFHETPVTVDGVTYRNAEAAFQAQKVDDPAVRETFSHLTGAAAKADGRKVPLREDWDEVKVEAMRKVIAAKFADGSEMADKLLSTGRRPLVEGNAWGDVFWGIDNSTGQGENILGKLLEERRAQLQQDWIKQNIRQHPDADRLPSTIDEVDAGGTPYELAGSLGADPGALRLADGSIDPDALSSAPHIPAFLRNLVDPGLPPGQIVTVGESGEFLIVTPVKLRELVLSQRLSHTGQATVDEVRAVPPNKRWLLGTEMDETGTVTLMDGHHTMVAGLLDENPGVADALKVIDERKLPSSFGDNPVSGNFLDDNPDAQLDMTRKLQAWVDKSPMNENKPRKLGVGVHPGITTDKTASMFYLDENGKVVSWLVVDRASGYTTVWTSPSARGKGYGSAVMDEFVKRQGFVGDDKKLLDFVSAQNFTKEGAGLLRGSLIRTMLKNSDTEVKALIRPKGVVMKDGKLMLAATFDEEAKFLPLTDARRKIIPDVRTAGAGPTIYPGHALIIGTNAPLPNLDQLKDVRVILISGPRKGNQFEAAIKADLQALAKMYDDAGIPKPVIMHGGAQGVDMTAHRAAREAGFEISLTPARWDNPGGFGVSTHDPRFDEVMVGGESLRKQHIRKLRWQDDTKQARAELGKARGNLTRWRRDNKGTGRTPPDDLVKAVKDAEKRLSDFGPDPSPWIRWVDMNSETRPDSIPWSWGPKQLDEFWANYEDKLWRESSRLSPHGDAKAREEFRKRLLDLRGKYLITNHKIEDAARFDPVPHINNVLARLTAEENAHFNFGRVLKDTIGARVGSVQIEDFMGLASKYADDPEKFFQALRAYEPELQGPSKLIYEALGNLSRKMEIAKLSGENDEIQALRNAATELLKKYKIHGVSTSYIIEHGFANGKLAIPPQNLGARLADIIESDKQMSQLLYFRGAGATRNERMFANGSPGLTLGYWDGSTAGTQHALKTAKDQGVPVVMRVPPGTEETNKVKFEQLKAARIAEEREHRMQVFGFYDPSTGTIKLNAEAFKSEDWRSMPFLLDSAMRFDEVGKLRHYQPQRLVTWHEEGHAFWLHMSGRHRKRWEKALVAYSNTNPQVLQFEAGEVFADAYMLYRADPDTLKKLSPEIHDVFASQPKSMQTTEELVRKNTTVEVVHKNTSMAGHGQSTDPDDLQMAWNVKTRTGMDPDELKVNSSSPTEFTSAIIHEKNMGAGILEDNAAMDVDRLRWETIDPHQMAATASKRGADKAQVNQELQTYYLPQWYRALVHWHSQSAVGREILTSISAGDDYDSIVSAVYKFLRNNKEGIAVRLGLRTEDDFLEHAKMTVAEIYKVTMGGDRRIAATALDDPENLKALLSEHVATLSPDKLPIINGQMPEQLEGRGPGFMQAIARKYTETLFAKATNQFSRQPYYKLKRAQHERALLGMMLANGEGMTPAAMRSIKMAARENAIADTWELLFDAQRQNRLAEMVRFFMPFAQPWAEALVVWSRLIQKNPSFFLHLYQGGRTLTEHGIIKQDRNGEWVIKVPFVGDFMTSVGNWLFPGGDVKQENDHFNLVFPLQSFNFMLASTINVGGIPVPAPSLWAPATFAAQKLADSDLLPDGMKSIMAQYAYQYGSVQSGGGFVRALMPTWMGNFLASIGAIGSQKDLYTQDFLILMESHGVTGVSLMEDDELAMAVAGKTFFGVEEANQWLIEEAQRKAQNFGLIRTFFGAIFPAPPILEFPYYEAQVRFDELKEQYPDDFDMVRTKFIEEYPDLKMLAVAATMWNRPDVSPVALPANSAVAKLFESGAADELMKINPQFLFALMPEEAWDAEFDRVEWMRQIDAGWRTVKTPEEFIASYETGEGWRHFFWAVEQRDAALSALEAQGLNDGDPQWQAVEQDYGNVVDYIKTLYPAFANDFAPDVELPATIIKNISQALDIPEFANTRVGKGLKEYFDYRDELASELEAHNIASIDNTVAERFGLTLEYEETVEALKLEYGDTFAQFFDHFLGGDLTEDYILTSGEQILHNLSQNEATWERVTAEQASWNDLLDKTDSWEPGVDPEFPAIALLYQEQRNMSNQWWKEYGNNLENPQYVWWNTRSYSEKEDYVLSLASRPFQYLSRFDKEVILGFTTTDWVEEAWGEVNYMSAFAAVGNEDNPAARDTSMWYQKADRAAAAFAEDLPDFERELEAANTWGFVFFTATNYGNRNTASDPAWQSVQKLVQQSQAVADAWKMGDDNNYDEFLRRMYIGLRTNLLEKMDMLAEGNPTFADEYEMLLREYPSFIDVLIPETYYRLG